MNVMHGDGFRRPQTGDGPAGRAAPRDPLVDQLPDPFEDVAAPPLRRGRRLSPPAVDVAPATRAESTPAAEAAIGADADASNAVDGPAAPVVTAPESPVPGVAAAGDPGMRQLRLAVVIGVLAAAAIVALAVLFRPAPAATRPEPPVALGSGPLPTPAAAAARAVAPVATTGVRLRLGPDVTPQRRAAIAGALVAAGYPAPEAAPSEGAPGAPRVEIARAADRPAAEALARALAPLTGAPLPVREAAAGGAGGGIEVWLVE
jgi:hypothetical protein